MNASKILRQEIKDIEIKDKKLSVNLGYECKIAIIPVFRNIIIN